jgi:predicted deacylase
MRVERLGEGEPEVAIVAALHGDEPCGVTAVERLLAADLAVRRPVLLIVANEEALAAGERFLEADLNRSFPGDPDSPAHEERLAAELADLVADCETLAIHSTRSHAEPFAVVDRLDDWSRRIAPDLPVASVVESGHLVEGRLFVSVERLVEVEAGSQGTAAAAENAHRIALAFLSATGALPGTPLHRELPVYRLTEGIDKEPAKEYEVYVDNFQQVDAGDAFAAADGSPLTADEPFYPVLLSADGYETRFGYAAERVGTLR